MLCSCCGILLDLDVSLPSEKLAHQPSPVLEHHRSLTSLYQAAETSCDLCSAVCFILDKKSPDVRRKHLHADFNGEVSCWIVPEKLFFTISIMSDETPMKYGIGFSLHTSIVDPLNALFPSRPISTDSSSSGCFALASTWLKTCLESHRGCPRNLHQLPSRVIDVTNSDKEPYLYVAKGECGAWLTLSHCWGTQHTLRTTTKNIDSHCKGEMQALPKTFLDAIRITRGLGYRYVWIDSLCIIQDSEEDWKAESTKMASVYQNAVLNISADTSEHDNHGIFNSAAVIRSSIGSISLPCHSSKRHVQGLVQVSPDFGNSFPYPLQKRGWVLQEAVLSTRILRYRNDGLSWTCQTKNASESNPEMKSPTVLEDDLKGINRLPHGKLISACDLDDSNQGNLLRWWYDRVNEYSERSLTFKKDRLPAIDGLATVLSDRTGGTYEGGIWHEDFHRALLWRSSTGREDLDLWPSWSWAVADLQPREPLPYSLYDLGKQGQHFLAELISLRDVGDGLSGRKLSLQLTLRGWAQSIGGFLGERQFYDASEWRNGSIQGREFSFDAPQAQSLQDILRGQRTSTFWSDTPLHTASIKRDFEQKQVIVFRIAEFSPLSRSGGSNMWFTYALILEPTYGSQSTYRRIGMMRIGIDWVKFLEDLINGYSMKTVVII